MANFCNLFSNDSIKYSASLRQLCVDGERAFGEDISPLWNIRREIGAKRLMPNADMSISQLKERLQKEAQPLKDRYIKFRKACDEKKDIKACGYAYYFDGFTKMFGPIDELKEPVTASSHVPLVRLVGGSLLADITVQIGDSIQSNGLQVVFDTGCDNTVFTRDFVSSNRMNFTLLEDNGAIFPSVYSAANLAYFIGTMQFSPPYGSIVPSEIFYDSSDAAHTLVSIIGADFMFSSPFEINYDIPEIIFNQDVRKRLSSDRWQSLPVAFIPREILDTYVMGIEVFLNAHSFILEFDTGAEHTVLSARCTEGLTDLQAIASQGHETMYGNVEVGRLAQVNAKMGNDQFMLNTVGVSSEQAGAMGPVLKLGLCGLLGRDVMRRYNMMVDPQTSTIYLAHRSPQKPIRNYTDIGFRWKLFANNNVVTTVAPHGPAWAAGLRKGDVIIKINGRNLADMSYLQRKEMFYIDGFTLDAKRGRHKKMFYVKLH